MEHNTSTKDRTKELLVSARRQVGHKRYKEAIEHLESVLAIDPCSREALDLMGFCFFFAGDYLEAERWCKRTLAHHPNHAYAHRGLGLSIAKQGRLKEAKPHLEKAIGMAPHAFDFYWDAAVVTAGGGDGETALDYLAKGLSACPGMAGRAVRLKEQLIQLAEKSELGRKKMEPSR